MIKEDLAKLNLDRFPFEAKALEAVMTTPFDKILSASFACGYSVAGGFLSNLYAGKKPKDMDVFCPPRMVGRITAMASRKSERLASEMSKRGFINPRTFGMEHKFFRYQGLKSISGIFEMDWTDGESVITIQFIGVDDYGHPTDRFDLNFRRMSITPKEYKEGYFSMAEEALEDFRRGEASVNVINNAVRNYFRIRRLAKTVGLKPSSGTLKMLKDCMQEYVDASMAKKEPGIRRFYEPFDGWYSQSLVRKKKSPLGKNTRILIGMSGTDSTAIYREAMRRMSTKDDHPIGDICGIPHPVNAAEVYGAALMDKAKTLHSCLDEYLKDLPDDHARKHERVSAVVNGILASSPLDLARNRWKATDKRLPAKLGRALKFAIDELTRLEPSESSLDSDRYSFGLWNCWNHVCWHAKDMLKMTKHLHVCKRNDLVFTISRDVEDIVSMSTDKSWDSCANIDDGYDYATAGIVEMISHGYVGLLRQGSEVVGRVNLRPGMYPHGSALIDRAYASDMGYRAILSRIAERVLFEHGIDPKGKISMPTKYSPYSDEYQTRSLGSGRGYVVSGNGFEDEGLDAFILSKCDGKPLSKEDLERLQAEYEEAPPSSVEEEKDEVPF